MDEVALDYRNTDRHPPKSSLVRYVYKSAESRYLFGAMKTFCLSLVCLVFLAIIPSARSDDTDVTKVHFTSHFTLTATGGTIVADVKPADDLSGIEKLRVLFNDYVDKMETRNQMRSSSKRVHYTLYDTPTGVRITMESGDYRTIGTIHDFLKHQIKALKTGDSTTVTY